MSIRSVAAVAISGLSVLLLPLAGTAAAASTAPTSLLSCGSVRGSVSYFPGLSSATGRSSGVLYLGLERCEQGGRALPGFATVAANLSGWSSTRRVVTSGPFVADWMPLGRLSTGALHLYGPGPDGTYALRGLVTDESWVGRVVTTTLRVTRTQLDDDGLVVRQDVTGAAPFRVVRHAG